VARGKDFYVAMAPSNAPLGTPLHRVIQSPTTISWRATFEPIRAELSRSYAWLHFGRVPESTQSNQLIQEWIRADQSNPFLRELLPEAFVRSAVGHNASIDLVHGARIGAAVSMERLHATVVTARLRRGVAQPVFGARALAILVPAAGDLSWAEIDDLRRHRDLRYLRDALRDIEAAAWEAAASEEAADRRIRIEYERRLRRANDRMEGTFRGGLVSAALGLVVGELTTLALAGLPVIGGVIGGTVGLGVDKVRSELRRPRWLSAEAALRKRADRRAVTR
jgi:hypothetical protein